MWGYPEQDIAISLYYVRNHPRYANLYNSFREGYQTVARWPLRDPRDLYPHFVGRILMFANYIVKLEDFDYDVKEVLDRYAGWVDELMK
jgi:hypothetical protein